MPSLRRFSPTNLYDGAQMAIFGDFFASRFSASRAQQVSDLHSKFPLRPHHVWKCVDIQSPTAEIRRGKKKKKPQHENIYGLLYYTGRP